MMAWYFPICVWSGWVQKGLPPPILEHFKSTSRRTASSFIVTRLQRTRSLLGLGGSESDVVPDGLLPVGHFARDLEVSLIGDDGQKVPNGEIGEIVVKNRFMVGYWRDPNLTAERFSIDLDGKGTRLVRTGDLGRINDDGLLELHGRKDDRVKSSRKSD